MVIAIRLFVILSLCFVLFACGFHSPYVGSHKVGEGRLGFVSVEVSGDSPELVQKLQRYTENMFASDASTGESRYKLIVNCKYRVVPYFVDIDGMTKRYGTDVMVDYKLLDLKEEKVIKSFSLSTSSGYNATSLEFSTFVSSESSLDSAAEIMAEELRIRVLMDIESHI